MKKVVLSNFIVGLLLVVLPFVMCSCQTEEEPLQTPVAQTNAEIETFQISPEVEAFYLSVDSLNKSFESASRKSFAGYGAVILADMGGRIAGRWIGRTAGAALGSLTGNPLLACLGYVGGQHVGAALGYAAASAAAECLISAHNSRRGVPKGEMRMIYDLRLKPSDYVDPSQKELYYFSDSLGIFHNEFLIKVNSIKETTIDENGEVNLWPIYFEIVNFLDEYKLPKVYYYKTTSYSIPHVILNFSKDIANMALENESDIDDLEPMLEKIHAYYWEIGVPDSVTSSFETYEYQMVKTVSTLEEPAIRFYAQLLKVKISTSDMSDQEKFDHTERAQALINSALIWSQAN